MLPSRNYDTVSMQVHARETSITAMSFYFFIGLCRFLADAIEKKDGTLR